MRLQGVADTDAGKVTHADRKRIIFENDNARVLGRDPHSRPVTGKDEQFPVLKGLAAKAVHSGEQAFWIRIVSQVENQSKSWFGSHVLDLSLLNHPVLGVRALFEKPVRIRINATIQTHS